MESEQNWESIYFVKETGLLHDFLNEYGAYRGAAIEKIIDGMKKHPIRKYLDKFSKWDKSKLVTPQTESAIHELDMLVDELNNLALEGTLTKEDFLEITNRINHLLYGK
ncbi:MAG TPA: hypothetical protein VE973_00970 [Candidatus Limnocylindria bacterium]|nr:hypothetical protein [Candidatus Limnocylindria bacterium]